MSTTFIAINTTRRLGAQMRNNLDQFRSALDGLRRLRATMATQIDGQDYTVMEYEFGLESGKGPAFGYQLLVLLEGLESNEPVVKMADKVNQFLSQCG